VSPELWALLEAEAETRDVSITTVVREALDRAYRPEAAPGEPRLHKLGVPLGD
jgi:hypothetical protein